MANRRGLSNQERLALSMATVTADASLVEAPCFLYSAVFSALVLTATGQVALGDSTASGDAIKELAKIDVTFGAGGSSAANTSAVVMNFSPPIFIAKTLVADITNAKVSVTYLAV